MAESPRIIELQAKFEDNPRRYFASLANEYRKAGDLARAISICRIYLEKQPAHTAGFVVLGQALHGTGKVEEAIEAFNTVLALDPENLIALKCLGEIAQRNGKLELAHDNFRQVLTADPRDHDTSARLKAVERALKESTEGVENWMPPRSDEFAIPSDPLPVFATESAPEIPEHVERSDERPIEPTDAIEVEVEVDSERVADIDSLPIEEIYEPGDFPKAAPDGSPHQSLEVDDLPALEPPVVHEDIPDDDFLDTLLPSSATEHHPAIAEPVALESAEETLAVPDLMEEAGLQFASPPASAQDEYNARTAEFSLPNYGSTESETGLISTEMEDEAEALLDEAEAPPAQAYDSGDGLQQSRTGEYSMLRDTGEWHQEPTEPPGLSPAHESDPGDQIGVVEPAGPFITETVAELYLQQGFTGEALLVYRQIARSKPGDQRIAGRIADLEQRLSEEHQVRQAALETPAEFLSVEPEFEALPLPVEPVLHPREESMMDPVVFDMTPAEPQRVVAPPPPPRPPIAVVDEPDDWFASGPVPPARARQTVQEFFAVLGRAKAEVKRKPERVRVTADDIRAAADVTAGFGAFGQEPVAAVPRPIAASVSGESDSQDDVRRFRSWLDGLSES